MYVFISQHASSGAPRPLKNYILKTNYLTKRRSHAFDVAAIFTISIVSS